MQKQKLNKQNKKYKKAKQNNQCKTKSEKSKTRAATAIHDFLKAKNSVFVLV
jgi:hypothetical protein